ncbi:tandem-95 repeat protein [Microvirga sp. M2]|uniref:tandem-95 repeat protein n=1 Tax=Microvirga sp. M2 TaxID=3073270 RepID=UPI0039C44C97
MTTETLVGGDLTNYTSGTWASNRVVTGADGKFYLANFVNGTSVNVQQWDGSQWLPYASFTTAQVGAVSFGDEMDLAVDADGHLHIVMESYYGSGVSGERGITHGEFSGSAWSFSKVQTSTHSNGWLNYDSPSVIVDQAGAAHVVYVFKDAATHTDYIRYATKTESGWSIDTLVTGTSGGGTDEMFYPWIGIGPDGAIHVTYTREDNQNDVWGNLYHTTKTGTGAWSAHEKLIDGVAEGKDYFYESSLDSDGVLHVIVTESIMTPDWTVGQSTVYEYVKGQGKAVLFSNASGSLYATGYQELGGVEYMLVAKFASDGTPQGANIYTRHSGGVWVQGNAVDVPDSYELTLAVNQDGKVMVVSLDTNLAGLTYDTGNAGGIPPSPNPVVTTGSGSTAYVENGTQAVDPDLTLTDADSASLASATVAITDNFMAGQDVLAFVNTSAAIYGNIVASYNASAGVLTLVSSGGMATLSQWQAALRAVTYTNLSDTPDVADRTVSFTANDGTHTSNIAAKVVTVQAVNDSPGFTGLDDTPSYVENGPAVVLDSNVSLFDAELDAANSWAGATLTLERQGGADASDQFLGSGVLTLTGSGDVVVSGTTVGTWSSAIAGRLQITFNANATPALVDQVAQSIAYQYAGDAPPSSVLIGWTVNDGASQSGTGSVRVNLIAVNDAPTATNMTQTHTFLEDSAPVALGDIVVTEVDTGDTIIATLTLSNPAAGTLTTATFGSATVTFDAGTGVWTATGSVADVNAALAAVTFAPTANWDQNVTITTRIRDAAGTGPADGTITLNVTPVDDPPTVSVPDGMTVAEDGTIALTGIAIGDVDGDAGTFTLDLVTGEGDFSVAAHPGLTVTISVPGHITIQGSMTDLKALISSGGITLTPNANFHGTLNLTVSFSDGAYLSTDTTSIAVTPVADTPTVTFTTVAEDDMSAPGLIISPAGVDGAEVTHFLITGITGGTLYLADGMRQIVDGDYITVAQGAAGLRFKPAADQNGSSGFGFDVQASVGADGTKLSPAVPASVIVTEVNDAPTAVDDVLPSVAEDSGAIVIPFADLLANDSAGPLESGQTLTITAVSDAIGGTVQIVGDSIVFTPAPDFYGQASFKYTVTDNGTTNGAADPKSATAAVSFSVTPGADTPMVMSVTTNEDTQSGAIVVSRSPVDGSEVTHFKITGITGGTLYLNDGVTIVANGSFITAAQAHAGLKFTPAPNSTDQGSFQVQASTSASDAGLGGGTVTATIDINPVNDAPTSTDGRVTLDEDGSYTFGASDFAFADPNDAAAPNALMSVVIDSLPVRGVLKLNGIAVSAGQEIALADIIGGKLVYTPGPDENGNGYASFTFRVKDDGGKADGGADTSAQHEISIDVTPVNDAAVIAGDLTGSVKEDDVTTVSGSLTVTDIEAGEAFFQPMAAVEGAYGTFSFDHLTGMWTYVLDNASRQVQDLREGETKHETFTVRSLDGTEKAVTVTVVGTKDAEVIDGVDVEREEIVHGDGSVSQVVTIPVVTAGRSETDGSALYADIPLVTAGGRPVLTVQVGVGLGLTASGFAAPKAAGASLADLIREIQAHAGAADRTTLSGGGAGFLAGLPASTPLLVQALTLTQAGAVAGVPLVISGDSSAQAPATALVIDARGLSAGTVIALDNVAFATILGAVRVTGGAGSQVVYGDGAAQHIVLGADDDTLHGGGGNDYIGSKGGNDWLYGDAGNDTVAGGIGDDHLYGGTGHDRLLGEAGHDRLEGGSGNDTLLGGSGHDTLAGGTGHDRLYGDAGNDRLYGGSGHDRLDGGSGHDRLDGGAGNDTLLGGTGNDTLVGGLGRDQLWGGAGRDVFVFTTVAESRVGAQRDVIHDFQSGHDRIDLRGIDANTRLAGNQAFSWTGADGPFLHPQESAAFLATGFTGRAGELRFANGLLMGDVDGDGRADFEIRIVGPLAAGDVIL